MFQVEQYHVKYNTEEDYIDPLGLEDGRIKVNVEQENTEIKGRIRYQGYESWSPWISSFSPVILTFDLFHFIHHFLFS